MPYIKEARREQILIKKPFPTGWQKLIVIEEIQTAGELNYAITELLKSVFKNSDQNYQAINDIIGAIEGAKVEFQRRIVAPYEDTKIKENGDVY